ncbi:hypothetical protein [Novosphingobium sp. Leaf2]|uniref:hypothetical protein n=1 Tax=Novosphingobium sp. Leaf2 TaxID=1735670 RepID=UPI000B005A55|nr:hypothetical protein [Novosphingobium sp. Leaf2]
MRRNQGFGWQTSLADLSLILFMLSAAALHGRTPANTPPPARVSARSEAVAVYEPSSGAPALATWLARQAGDPRQQLTITARYGPSPGAREEALAQAARLAGEAGVAGRAARIVVEPGAGPVQVALAYDVPGAQAGTGLADDGPSASRAQR